MVGVCVNRNLDPVLRLENELSPALVFLYLLPGFLELATVGLFSALGAKVWFSFRRLVKEANDSSRAFLLLEDVERLKHQLANDVRNIDRLVARVEDTERILTQMRHVSFSTGSEATPQ